MIFITLGSQKFQFNRLLKAVDELVAAGKIKDEVFAQIGYSDYKPMNYKYEQFLDREKFSQVMDKAEIVITHGGTGAIIGAVKKGKKVIAVPRLAKYGEHVDNHQLQLVGQFKELNLICECQDCAKLEEAIQTVKSTTYNEYKSNTQVIIDDITKFIGDVFAPIFFGEEFLRSGYVIEFLAPTIIFVAWADVIRMQYLIPNHQDRIYIISMIMGAIVNVCLNAMLIPVVGAIGAAIGTIGAEGTVFVIQAFGSRKELPLKKYAFEIIPYMINGLLMYATVTIVKRIFAMSIFGLFVEIAIGGLVYVVLTLLYWKISKNEFGNMAFNLISKTLHKKIAR